MGEVEVLGLMAVGVVALLLLIGARSQAAKANRLVHKMSERLEYAERYIGWLDRELRALRESVSAAPVQPVASETQTAPAEDAVQATPLATEPQSEPRSSEPQVEEPDARESEEKDDAPAAEPSAPSLPEHTAPPTAPFDWENVIGVRLFAWLGGGTLFLGAGLFLNYSIQQNLISPAMRVAIGLLCGAAALAGGDRLRRRTRMAAEAISGAGVGILYASLFAAHSLYHLIDTTPAFLGMGLVTATAGIIAVRRGAFLVAVLGLIGGMATPYLLSTGEDRPIPLFLYVLSLDACILIVAKKRSWPVLSLLGFVGSLVLCVGWAWRYLDPSRTSYTLVAVGLVAALFALVEIESTANGESKRAQLPRLVSTLGVFLPFAAAVAFSFSSRLTIPPWVLVGYLIAVSALAWLAGQRAGARSLVPYTAAFSALTLIVRLDHGLIPDQRANTLACFALVPLSYLAGWYIRRRESDELPLRVAAGTLLCAAVLVVERVALLQYEREPRFGTWLFALAHSAGLLVLAAFGGPALFIALAQAVSFCSLLMLTGALTQPAALDLAPICVSGLLFFALPLMSSVFRRDRAAWMISALSLPLHFLLLYGGAHRSWGAPVLGAIAVFCAALALYAFQRSRRVGQELAEGRLLVHAVLGAQVLVFLTCAVPILLDKEWLTLSWALEVAALAWLHQRVPRRGLVWASALLAGVVSARLLLNSGIWYYYPRSGRPILNFYLYTFGVPVLAFLGAAKLFDPVAEALALRLPRLLRVVAALLLFQLLNIEIADFYSTGDTITFQFAHGGLAQDMTYSLAWLLFGLGLMALGILRHEKAPRIGAILVIIVTLGKVFLHDLWALGALYRVGSMIGLAVALLLVSFLGQRFILRKDAP